MSILYNVDVKEEENHLKDQKSLTSFFSSDILLVLFTKKVLKNTEIKKNKKKSKKVLTS